MAVVNTIADLAAWLGWYVVPFILILSLIVSIHELGHYLVGRWCGVKIDAFSLGFGPELWARVDSHGTRWRVGALPLGGYVKFHGDANVASVEGRASQSLIPANPSNIQLISPPQLTTGKLLSPVASSRAITFASPNGVALPLNVPGLLVVPSNVEVDGGYAEFQAETAAIMREVCGRTVTAADIFAAAQALERAYATKGYLSVRVAVPPQRVADGETLHMTVVDGIVPSTDVIDRSLTLAGQPLRNRAAIVAAGPIANFLLAFVIFAGMFMAFGRVEHLARIGRVEASSPAAAAGFQAGDVVKSINGQPINSFEALQESTLMSTGLPMNFVVDRDGRAVELTATPKITVVDQGVFGKRRMGHLGLASSANPNDVRIERCGLLTCAAWGAQQEWFIVKATGTYIVGIFAGRESTDQMSGLIGAAQMAGEMAKISFWELFSLAAWFSVSVGLMNLLPVPLLDGGHLAFYAFEGLRGRPLSERAQEIGLRIGIALVALLVVFTTSHDILRLVTNGN
jgi:regulator of sigma E protease